MTILKTGDSAILTTDYGDAFSVLITDTIAKEDETIYKCLRDGVWANANSTPDFTIQEIYIYDPHHLKDIVTISTKDTSKLTYREEEPGDNEKRALWYTLIKKHDDAIAAKWHTYSHIHDGATVKWLVYSHATRQPVYEHIGRITCITNNFLCYVNDKNGKEHNVHISDLKVVEDDPSISPLKQKWAYYASIFSRKD